MGFGNGISAGIVLTLGADTSPRRPRPVPGRLAAVRDLGNTLGPLLISAISAVAPLLSPPGHHGRPGLGGRGVAGAGAAYALQPRTTAAADEGRDRRVSRVNDLLVWMDCEMTGLDLDHDELVEVAALVTDAELNVLGEGVDLVIKPSRRRWTRWATSSAACTTARACWTRWTTA